MFHVQQNSRSPWQRIEPPIFPPLQENRSTEVCVVGAGIAGSLAAYVLLKHGHQVILIDKEPFGENESGRTTGHVSNALDEGYAKLIRMHGLEGARVAFESHSDAIDLIEKIINEEKIDCDFRRVTGYLMGIPPSEKSYLENEFACLRKVGFSEAELISEIPGLPQKTAGIVYPRQGELHLLKFIKGLWEAINLMGGEIFTLTKITNIHDGEAPHLETEFGHTIRSKKIIVCTNVPINDRFGVHLKQAAYRTYSIGSDISSDTFPHSLMWDIDSPYHYIRLIKDTSPGFDTLLVGGEDHRVGQKPGATDPYVKLEQWMNTHLGIHTAVTVKWSGQIIEPADGLAYIGKSPGQENIYICCGDSGHGITHGAIAAIIFKDLVEGHPNSWLETYNPQRLNFRASQQLLKENLNNLTQYRDLMYLEKALTQKSLKPGEGTLARHGLEPIALYCDENNQIHRFSALCPHLAGVVHWNSFEKTWDCPCHGSRFSATGEVLNGPAIENLRPGGYRKSDEIQSVLPPPPPP